MFSKKVTLGWVLLLDIVSFGGGVILSYRTAADLPGISLSLVVPTIVTFIGILWVKGIRDAIAAGFFVAYICLMFTTIVLDLKLQSDIAKDFITNFQSLMQTVVAFYFVSAAVVETTKTLKGSDMSEAVADAPEAR